MSKKILLYHGRKWGDKIIEGLSSSIYSHVGILLETNEVLDSYPLEGVKIRPIDHDFKDGFVDVYDFNDKIPKEVLEKFEAAVDEQVNFIKNGGNIPYDFQGVAAFVFKKFHENPDTNFCSENIALFFEKIEWPIFCVPAHEVTPCDIGKLWCIKKVGQIKL